jgi:thiamine pyrophosphate-dependent acetolactate synthase large subunit-like protein
VTIAPPCAHRYAPEQQWALRVCSDRTAFTLAAPSAADRKRFLQQLLAWLPEEGAMKVQAKHLAAQKRQERRERREAQEEQKQYVVHRHPQHPPPSITVITTTTTPP